MTRRRGAKPWAIAGFGAAGAAIVVTATVLLGSATVNGQGPTAGDTVVMSAVQRDLSLTADQTGARLKKEAWASGAERRLQKALGADFAGAWMTKNGQALTVGVTSEQAADVVRKAGATPKLVERSQAELDAFLQRLNSTKATDSAVTGWYVDPASNRLVVVTKTGDTAAAQQLAAAGGVPSEAVRVVTAKEAPRLLFDVQGGDPYFIDNQFRCSIGFAVQGGFLSAGHCGQVGSTTTGFNQQAQGTFKASEFPGNGDFSFVEVNGDWTPQPVVATSTGLVPVAGDEEAPIGATVCRTGSTTGTHCGVIQAKNATVRYPEGTVTGLTQTDVCAEGGDSGGPWLSGNQAQGVTSGGSGDCTAGGTTFFQPLAEILAVDNLQLITTSDPAPPATDPPATDPVVTPPAATDPPTAAPPAAGCPETEASFDGTLRHSGSRQAVPANGFRSHGGQQQACLSGPAGANFDLALQQWTGSRWRTVARAATDGSVEQLTFSGRAGVYRYTVTSAQGSGDYLLGIDVP